MTTGRRSRAKRMSVGLVVVGMVWGACDSPAATTTSSEPDTTTTAPTTTTTTMRDCPVRATTPESLDAPDATRLSILVSQAMYECADDAVVAEPTPQALATAVATVGSRVAPILVAGPGVDSELERLGSTSITWVGSDPAPMTTEAIPADEAAAPIPVPPASADTVWVYSGTDPISALVVQIAASRSGHGFVDVGGLDDLRAAHDDVVRTLRAAGTIVPVGLDDAQRAQLAAVRTAAELPGGGFTFDGTRLVAFYGNPTTRFLGVLGEQGPAATLDRLLPIAAAYAADGLRTIPTFEIIATVASSRAGADGDYSDEAGPATLRPWVDFAAENGVYVVLDLQPGRTDFLTQAQRYEEFLRLPHVGLALDPEWRLEPDQVHLRQIGSVDASEINAVSRWLTEIVRDENLPQKYFLVHQFRFSMITDRDAIETPPELFTVIQMDGQGPLPTKYETYAAITAGQEQVGWHWGWKNFYDEDTPTATPDQVLDLTPVVVFVSFQ